MTFYIGDQKFRYGVNSEKGLFRAANEDMALIVTDFVRDYPQACIENGIQKSPFVLFAIFDGHDGVRAARYAAQYLPVALMSRWRTEKNISLCVQSAIADIEHQILQKGFDDGTTALILIIFPDGKYYIANIGDCEGIIVYQPVRLSERHRRPLIRKEPLYSGEPHNLARNPEEICRISMEGGEIIDHRLCLRFPNGEIFKLLALSRALGDRLFKSSTPLSCTPEITERRLTGYEDMIIMACDGLWDVFSIDDVFDVVRVCQDKKLSIKEIIQVLTTLAYQRGSTDNITIIILSFENK